MGQQFDPSDESTAVPAAKSDGSVARLPPVAAPPRKVSAPPAQANLPEMAIFTGLRSASQPPESFGPLPRVSSPPGRATLPPISPPSRRPPAPPSRAPSRSGSPASSREGFVDSITRVHGPLANDTVRDAQAHDPTDLAMTTPAGSRAASQPQTLDWDEEEESTHVFHSSAPPPPNHANANAGGDAWRGPGPSGESMHARSFRGSDDGRSNGHGVPSPRMSRPITTRIEHDLGDDLASTIPADTPPPPRSSFSYGLQPRIVPPSRSSTYPGGNGYPSASSPPTTDTIRLDAIQDTHGQALPPPPPVPSSQSLPYAARAPQMRGGHPTGGHDSNGVGYNGAGSNGAASNGAASNGAVVAGAKEVVVSDQAYVRLPMGNPHTATELAIRKPTVPAHLLPQSLTRAAQNYTPAIIVGGDERRSRRSLFVVAGATAVITLLAAFTFIYMRREGVLEVEVRDPAGASVPVAQVYVDGRKVCEAMPCIVRDVEPGRHGVRVVTANSPDNEPVSVEVTPGSVAKISVALRPSLASLVAESDQPGVRLFVDGVDRGTLPAKITDLAPGKHEIQLTGDRYKSTQRSIEVKAGESADLGGIKLDVSKGRVLLAPKTEGADILLVPNDDLARAKRVKGPFPFAVDVVIPGDKWKLVAKKQGYPDFVVPIDFSDGVPEKTIEISFGNNDKVALNVDSLPTTPSGPAPAPNPKSSPAADPPSRPEKDDSAAASTGMATLNINSLPVSRILLDGQPMGETPRTGIQVTPGTHTVTFVHPELGKKSVSVNVKAGESKAVSTRLRAD